MCKDLTNIEEQPTIVLLVHQQEDNKRMHFIFICNRKSHGLKHSEEFFIGVMRNCVAIRS